MAKLGSPVQYRMTNTYDDDRDWMAAIVTKVDPTVATKFDLDVFPPGKPMTSRQGVAQGTGLNNWREIP